MKLLLAFVLMMGVSSANASQSVQGAYVEKGRFCEQKYLPGCADLLVSTKNGVTTVSLENGTVTARVYSKAGGRYVFDTGDLDFDTCDNPGCYDTLQIKGVLYKRTYKGKTSYAAKVYYYRSYQYPEDETSPEGLVTETVTYYKNGTAK